MSWPYGERAMTTRDRVWLVGVRLDRDIYEKYKTLGGITPRDEQLILRETPPSMLAPTLGFLGGISAAFLYGTYRARPPWNLFRHFYMSQVAGVVGVAGGAGYVTLEEFRRFTSCENPKAVMKAVTAMRAAQDERDLGRMRGGKTTPVGVETRTPNTGQTASDAGDGDTATVWGQDRPKGQMNKVRHVEAEGRKRAGQVSVTEQTQPVASDGADWQAAQSGVSEPSDDAISDTGQSRDTDHKATSAWDAIRQGNYSLPPRRTRDSSARRVPTDGDTVAPEAPAPDTRTDEQRAFDELLENERNFGQKGDGKSDW